MNLFKLPSYVGIILKDNNKVLLVRRHNTDWMSDYWNFPGGLLEDHETLVQAAVRETKEEIGVIVEANSFELVHVIHVHKNNKNTKDILGFYFMAQKWHGTPFNAEPNHHSTIEWFALDNVPHSITDHALFAINGLKENNRYSEHGW